MCIFMKETVVFIQHRPSEILYLKKRQLKNLLETSKQNKPKYKNQIWKKQMKQAAHINKAQSRFRLKHFL